MVQLPGGKFQMGSGSTQSRDEEGPIREVTVKPFAIDKFPVTNRDFRMGNTPDSASDNLSFRCAADIPSRTTKSSRTKPEL
ncbi:hypothetical protein ASZ78_007027 [Callipepla squamata]|uniref:Sulfatase-modifying factor enzyme-like domain-containing protein n=1 Tax=Callipepla squamata TaxID=9009 RepID=A0A226MQV8_CALSU|nr:hypothetical protein ASZ78_007027 [Callipepla squamata]